MIAFDGGCVFKLFDGFLKTAPEGSNLEDRWVILVRVEECVVAALEKFWKYGVRVAWVHGGNHHPLISIELIGGLWSRHWMVWCG